MADRRSIAWAVVTDVAAIVLFVILGRRSHHEDGTFLVGTLKVAAPFLIALGIGWIAARGWTTPSSPTTGIIIWVITVVGGMLLRHFAFSRGTAVPFIIVTSAFTMAFLVGWRLLWERRTTRR